MIDQNQEPSLVRHCLQYCETLLEVSIDTPAPADYADWAEVLAREARLRWGQALINWITNWVFNVDTWGWSVVGGFKQVNLF